MEEADLHLLDAIRTKLDTKRVSYRVAMRILGMLIEEPDLYEGSPSQTEHAKEVLRRINRDDK